MTDTRRRSHVPRKLGRLPLTNRDCSDRQWQRADPMSAHHLPLWRRVRPLRDHEQYVIVFVH